MNPKFLLFGRVSREETLLGLSRSRTKSDVGPTDTADQEKGKKRGRFLRVPRLWRGPSTWSVWLRSELARGKGWG